MGFNNPSGSGGLWTLLHSETLLVAGTFDVTGLSQSHETLICELIGRTDGATTVGNVMMFANGDTTLADYRRSVHFAGASHSVAQVDDAQIGFVVGATGLANTFGFSRIVIPQYTNPNFWKAASCYGGYRHQTTSQNSIEFWWTWENLSAITQLTFEMDNDPTSLLDANSRLLIWGVSSS